MIGREMEQSLDTTSDQLLMLTVREGDIEKLGILFERHHRRLFNFFLRLTARRHLSEDLVQEVFVRLLKYRNTYREKNGFTAWMFQIARNVHIDFHRKIPFDEVGIENGEKEHASLLPTPCDQSEENEKMQIVQRALSKLSVEKREILLLRGIHGLKFEEIAGIMKCSVNTVKARAFRAVRDLRVAVHRIESVREI